MTNTSFLPPCSQQTTYNPSLPTSRLPPTTPPPSNLHHRLQPTPTPTSPTHMPFPHIHTQHASNQSGNLQIFST